MDFRILSHAGLAVSGAGTQLICDPWLVGSTYWRSWWNYPPVSPDLVASLKPDFIYLTHVHWDHFQGPSLRKFPKETAILLPKEPSGRMKRDLHAMGYRNTIELGHGETFALRPGFTLTSYHFSVFLDSAAVIECEGTVLFNANDAKFMGAPLRQILKRHPRIDFVFRSHSSANSRLCYDVVDQPSRNLDDGGSYVEDFADFTVLTGARYAIPFASNHCFLHKDTFAFNDTVTTPLRVEEHFRKAEILRPEVKVMVSGDGWSSGEGFRRGAEDHFSRREELLSKYRDDRAAVLERFYRLEAKASIGLPQVEKYFARFFAALPYPARRFFKGKPVTYVVTAGERTQFFEVDVHGRKVRELKALPAGPQPMEIHTSTHIFRQCMALDLFSSLGISKRVRYRATSARIRHFFVLGFLFNLYEYEMLPLRRLANPRFILAWLPRWREILLYGSILAGKARGRRFDMTRYLAAPEPRPTRAGTEMLAPIP